MGSDRDGRRYLYPYPYPYRYPYPYPHPNTDLVFGCGIVNADLVRVKVWVRMRGLQVGITARLG